MKHTPGPWKVEPIARNHVATKRDFRELRGEGGPLGVYIFCPPGFGNSSYEVEKANACLIAAAPDLLEAVKMFIDLYGGHTPDDSREQRYEIIAARRAIKAAEGEGDEMRDTNRP